MNVWCNMKNRFIKIALVSVLAASSFAQTNPIIMTDDVDIKFFKSVSYKVSQGDTVYHFIPDEMVNIKCFTFLTNDSLIIKNVDNLSAKLKLQHIRELNQYTERINTFLAAGLGAAGGAIIGGVIAYALYENDYKGPLAKMFEELERLGSAGKVALIGALGGAILGALVSEIVNHATLDLFSVPEKDKKSELIKFLRNK
jgi:hypothetical protein